MTTLAPGWLNMGGRMLYKPDTAETIVYPLKDELPGSSGWSQDLYNRQLWTNPDSAFPFGLGPQVSIEAFNTLEEAFEGSPGPAPDAFLMNVGSQTNLRGFGSGYGTLAPGTIAGLTIGQWTANSADGAGLFFLTGNLQIPGITIIRANVLTDGYGSVADYIWNGTFGYENTDAAFGTFMNQKAGLDVDFEVTQLP